MNKTQTRTAEIYLDENNIVNLVMRLRLVVDLEDAIDNYLVIKDVAKKQTLCKINRYS